MNTHTCMQKDMSKMSLGIKVSVQILHRISEHLRAPTVVHASDGLCMPKLRNAKHASAATRWLHDRLHTWRAVSAADVDGVRYLCASSGRRPRQRRAWKKEDAVP